jgi:PAS domain S-box-containing protein
MSSAEHPSFEFNHFFESTPDLVCIAGKDGFFRKVNQAVINKLGFTKEELFSKRISALVHPQDRELTKKGRAKLLAGEVLLNFINRYITKSGNIVWLEWTSVFFDEQEIVFAIAKDITKRKEAESELEEKYKKFKSLAAYFKNSIEEDRKFLAYELHEELAQLASVVKMQLEMIPLTFPGLPEAALAKIENTAALSRLLVKTIQRISFSISPAMLDEFGFNATMEWLCREFSLLNGIACNFSGIFNSENLSLEIKTDFFRICQESLNNVMYHAQASQVDITITDIDNSTILCIADNGKGFAVNQPKPRNGLQSMHELAASINGSFTIESEPGKGTTVSVCVINKSS